MKNIYIWLLIFVWIYMFWKQPSFYVYEICEQLFFYVFHYDNLQSKKYLFSLTIKNICLLFVYGFMKKMYTSMFIRR